MQLPAYAIDLGLVLLKPSPGPEAKDCCKVQTIVSYPKRRLSWDLLLNQMEISCVRKAIYQKTFLSQGKVPLCQNVWPNSIAADFVLIGGVTSGASMSNICSTLLCVLHLSHIIGLTLIAVASWYSWAWFSFMQPPERRKIDAILKERDEFPLCNRAGRHSVL